MKKTFVILFAFILVLFSCKSGSNDSSTSGEQTADINPAALVLIDMDVNGMTCTGCENTIKTGLSGLAGVVEVEASHMDAKTFVMVDTSLTSPEEIAQMISSKGYEVTASVVSKTEIELKKE